MRRIRQIKHNTGVRLGSPTIINPTSGKLLFKINTAIEMQATIRIDIDIQRAEISRGVDEPDIAGLHKVIGNNDVFLVRRDLNVVRADCGLGHRRVIETPDVVEIMDVEGGDVVGGRECEVCEFPVLGDVGTGWESKL
jgi:hypothetical protein